jgi:uncharacterized membrane protein YgcG
MSGTLTNWARKPAGIATVDSSMVKREDIEDNSLIMLNTWDVGKREKNNGILIVIKANAY